MAVYIETIPLDADDDERGRAILDLAAFVADLKDAGMDPVVGVETTSGGDVYLIDYDDGGQMTP